MSPLHLFLIPVICGAVYWVLQTLSLFKFFMRHSPTLTLPRKGGGEDPALPREGCVSLIKPICGLERNLGGNLRSALLQDHPDHEILFAVQDRNDPALPLLEKLRAEFPGSQIEIVVDETAIGPNGRLSNIYNGWKRSRGKWIVFSDSDMRLAPDYLRTITAPLADPKVGAVCTLYKAVGAKRWFENLELLSLNAEFVPSMIFAAVTGASLVSPGGSQAVRRDVLEKIGGLEIFSHDLVEDFELGRKITESGYRLEILPVVVETQVDLQSPKAWWRHQVYWDQNTLAAAPLGFFATLLVRPLPFAFLYILLGGAWGAHFLAGLLGTRFATAILNALLLKDREGLRALWLLPLRDLFGLFFWLAALGSRKVYWKGRLFRVKRGKMAEIG